LRGRAESGHQEHEEVWVAAQTHSSSGRDQAPRSGPGRPAGGSELKRAAIVEAALRLFGRDGFARTSVDAIADEAGVSKRTIYNHYGDKENLFLSVVNETYAAMIARVVELMDKYLTDLPDDAIEENFIAFAYELGLFATRSEDRQSLIRVMIAEAPHFAALREAQLRPRGITHAIAERLTRLSARGLLDVPEPQDAASHLFSLTMGQISNRSLYGALPITDAEIQRMATSGVRAFLRAYRVG
jgi:TetR/AcrR family transcriptional regulator, mexJK operon transcriptional repressor